MFLFVFWLLLLIAGLPGVLQGFQRGLKKEAIKMNAECSALLLMTTRWAVHKLTLYYSFDNTLSFEKKDRFCGLYTKCIFADEFDID